MMDVEKVIKGLERFKADFKPFCGNGSDWARVDDAINLLKEQEAKPMIENERGWNCPSCGIELIGKTASGYPCDLIDLPINFCPRCGQEVESDV